MKKIMSLTRRRRGASLTGYGLVVGLIAVAALAATGQVGDTVSALFGTVGDDMDAAAAGLPIGGGNGGGDEGNDEEEEEEEEEEVAASCAAGSAPGGWTHDELADGASGPGTRTGTAPQPDHATAWTDETVISCSDGMAGEGSVTRVATACDAGYTVQSGACEDITAPVFLSIERLTPATENTGDDTLVFRASFDETVTGVDIGDFAVTGGSTAGVTGASGSAAVYDLTVSGGDLAGFNGAVGLLLQTGHGIADPASNPLPDAQPATSETYTLANAVPWDVGYGVSYASSVNVQAQDDTLTGLFFKSDGTRLYITGNVNDQVHQYNLGTAWDLGGTVTHVGFYSVLSQEGTPTDVFFKPDRTNLLGVGKDTDT
jgi:Flp pilus assembly pilin Flp